MQELEALLDCLGNVVGLFLLLQLRRGQPWITTPVALIPLPLDILVGPFHAHLMLHSVDMLLLDLELEVFDLAPSVLSLAGIAQLVEQLVEILARAIATDERLQHHLPLPVQGTPKTDPDGGFPLQGLRLSFKFHVNHSKMEHG